VQEVAVRPRTATNRLKRIFFIILQFFWFHAAKIQKKTVGKICFSGIFFLKVCIWLVYNSFCWWNKVAEGALGAVSGMRNVKNGGWRKKNSR
jgi:hypothetical protein